MPRFLASTFLACSLGFLASASSVGCGDDTSSGGSGGSGGSGAGGAGGSGAGGSPGATSKPVCSGEPSGSEVPLARGDAAAAFAPDGSNILMFGGDTATVVCGELPKREHVADTWLLDPACGGWTELQLSNAPPARARHTMSTHEASGRAILFGGRTRDGDSGPYELFGDVWAFNFEAQTWSELQTTGGGPSPRSNTSSFVVGDTFYVYGGSDTPSATAFAPQADLWALDLMTNAWTELAQTGTLPPARLFHAMAGDASTSRLWVMGGGDEGAFIGPFFSDLWEYDIASDTWSEVDASLSAVTDPSRIKAGLFAEAADAGTRLHMFGGHDDGELGNRNDVAVLDSAAWRLALPADVFNNAPSGQCDFPADFTLLDEASPERRSGFGMAAHPNGKAFVVFAGDTDCGRASDAWWYDAVLEKWEVIRATPVGLSCLRFGQECSGLCG